MSGLRVSSHAVSRYRERVEPVTYDEAMRRLTSPVIVRAAELGCCAVKLPGGQRVVIHERCVVTVRPRTTVRRDRRRLPECED